MDMTTYVLVFLLGAQSVCWLAVEFDRSRKESHDVRDL